MPIYIDDVIVFSKTFEEHVEHIRALMKAIEEESFALKFMKRKFAQREINIWGM